MRIRKVAKVVKVFLTSSKKSRDSDEWLTAHIWAKLLSLKGYDIDKMSARDLLKIYATESFLPHTESIRRARQKIQEIHPELRGDSYRERKTKKEEAVREDVKRLDKQLRLVGGDDNGGGS